MYSDTSEATTVPCGHKGGAVSDGGVERDQPPRTTCDLEEIYCCNCWIT